MFNGYVIHENKVVGFNSGDDHHKIDGLKVDQFSMKVLITHPDEVDDLIDYLEILKLTLIDGKTVTLSDPGKDFQGHKLTRQHLIPGTEIALSDGNKYIVANEQWDGIFVPVLSMSKGGFKLADIELVRLINN